MPIKARAAPCGRSSATTLAVVWHRDPPGPPWTTRPSPLLAATLPFLPSRRPHHLRLRAAAAVNHAAEGPPQLRPRLAVPPSVSPIDVPITPALATVVPGAAVATAASTASTPAFDPLFVAPAAAAATGARSATVPSVSPAMVAEGDSGRRCGFPLWGAQRWHMPRLRHALRRREGVGCGRQPDGAIVPLFGGPDNGGCATGSDSRLPSWPKGAVPFRGHCTVTDHSRCGRGGTHAVILCAFRPLDRSFEAAALRRPSLLSHMMPTHHGPLHGRCGTQLVGVAAPPCWGPIIYGFPTGSRPPLVTHLSCVSHSGPSQRLRMRLYSSRRPSDLHLCYCGGRDCGALFPSAVYRPSWEIAA